MLQNTNKTLRLPKTSSTNFTVGYLTYFDSSKDISFNLKIFAVDYLVLHTFGILFVKSNYNLDKFTLKGIIKNMVPTKIKKQPSFHGKNLADFPPS